MFKASILNDIKNSLVINDSVAISNLYNMGYFGRIKNNKLYIKFVEAAYLLYKNKIEIIEKNDNCFSFENFFLYCSKNENYFELKYIVYKDLKERGYYIQSNIDYFRLYQRGSHPLKSKSKYFIFVQSEREDLKLEILIDRLILAINVHKDLILAIVDEESDITYYKIKLINLSNSFLGLMKSNEKDLLVINKVKAILLKERVIIFTDNNSIKLYTSFFYGKQLDELRLQLSFIEALYLIEKKIIQIYDLDFNVISTNNFIN